MLRWLLWTDGSVVGLVLRLTLAVVVGRGPLMALCPTRLPMHTVKAYDMSARGDERTSTQEGIHHVQGSRCVA
jgi:hypothetical protein